MIAAFNELYGSFRTVKFTDVWDDVNKFIADYDGSTNEFANGIPTTISIPNANTLYYLLYAKYGNSHIANSDITQFKYRLFATIFSFGNNWEANLEAQTKLMALTDEEKVEAQRTIVNHSYNPGEGTDLGTNTNVILNNINDQNVNKTNVSKLTGYAMWSSLIRDVTTDFLEKFKPLFITIVNPELPLYYTSDTDE